ncbi:MAG: MutS-related protein family 1 [Myxococcaceae bacterium]|nr:MutS-related protein family 1 [Myxococcaceae bacterium]
MKVSVKTVNERASGHESRVRDLSIQRDQLETKANRISLFRLLTFLGAASAMVAGLKQAMPLAFLLAALLAIVFFAAVAWHARVISAKHGVEVRIEINQRMLKRMAGHWHDLPSRGEGLISPSHPYASDIDLTGVGSLFQRIDVSQTREGERALAAALSEPAPWPLIEARHPAVLELTDKEVFREEIEALGSIQQRRSEKLDHTPFMALFSLPSVFATRRWLKPLALVLLTTTGTVLVLVELEVLPSLAIWACVFVQGVLLYGLREPVHGALDLLTARLGFAQAYQAMLRAIEDESFSAPYLQGLQRRLRVAKEHNSSASTLMSRLSRYEGFAQLRTQGPLYIVLNLLTLWDLFCLERIEKFAADVGPHCADWFKVVGEVELLCSFATLRHIDPNAVMPKLDDSQVGLRAEGLLHPLLPFATRVENDLTLPGSGSALLVTGSNMAGKSTLLRAVGLNVALALAGAPVCARSFSVSLVRLRASMRIDDSLQRGASYFHAELTRLRMVVGELDAGPPVLFLLDELLRGTNAHARHQGARAVLLHLLARGALGLVATHDVALAELEDELPGQVRNVHFTDVFEHGEMRFDYTLREGVVKTSNALRLLAMAGIEVPDSDAVA